MDADSQALLQMTDTLARQVAALGETMGLPYVAAAADIGSTHPMRGSDGRPLAESVFRWIDPDLRYWEDRAFALRAAFIHAARGCSEPFYFAAGRFGSWRPNRALDAITNEGPIDTFGVTAAIVAPAYLPGGVIGAVVWATAEPGFEIEAVFAAHATQVHALALKLVATYEEAVTTGEATPARLTRREIQCLKWAAAGKTDAEIGDIVAISLPTVRFHITNAGRKLGAGGRSQAISRAATLGYIGAGEGHATSSPMRSRP